MYFVISQSRGCACPKNPHPKNGSFLSIRAPIFRSPRNFDNIRAPKFRSPRNFDGARASIFAHLFAFRSQTRFAPLHFALPRNPLTQEIRAPKKSAPQKNSLIGTLRGHSIGITNTHKTLGFAIELGCLSEFKHRIFKRECFMESAHW